MASSTQAAKSRRTKKQPDNVWKKMDELNSVEVELEYLRKHSENVIPAIGAGEVTIHQLAKVYGLQNISHARTLAARDVEAGLLVSVGKRRAPGHRVAVACYRVVRRG